MILIRSLSARASVVCLALVAFFAKADEPMMAPDTKNKSAVFPDIEKNNGRRPASSPAAQATTTQATTQPTAPLEIDLPPLRERLKVSMVVKSVSIDRVNLRRVTPLPPGRRGINETQSQDFLLVVKMEVHNDCNIETLVFQDAGGATPETSPNLEDATGQGFPSVTFGDFEPSDSIRKTTIAPGQMVPAVLVFAPPPGDVTPLHLRYPLKVTGRSVLLEADIDPKSIKRR